MLDLGSTYLIVNDFQKSINFYEMLLEMKVSSQNYNRWAQFNFGKNSCIALFNYEYDNIQIRSGKDLDSTYSKSYLNYIKSFKIKYGNNFVLNLFTDDLKAEYERLKTANIGDISEIMYLNVASPYYFFNVIDPDGNIIEITGEYSETTDE